MASNAKNQHIQCQDVTELRNLVEEYRDYAGRDVDVDEKKLTLTVLALPRNYKKKAELENKLRRQRQLRDSSYAIPSDEDYEDYASEW